MNKKKLFGIITICLILIMGLSVPVSAATVAPSVNMQSITVQPYYINDNGTKTTLAGYTHTRNTNYTQAIFYNVTQAQKETMEQRVTDAGYDLAGYKIVVNFTMNGSFTNGRVVTNSPANVANISVMSGLASSATFYTTADEPNLSWDAYFSYIYSGKYLTQAVDAGVTFPTE